MLRLVKTMVLMIYLTGSLSAQDRTYTIEELEAIGRQTAEKERSASEMSGMSEQKHINLTLPEAKELPDLTDKLIQAGKTALDPSNMREEKKLFIFVSLSMSNRELTDIMRDAKRYGASILIRGFYKGSVPNTMVRIQELRKTVPETEIAVDPLRFKMYDVTKVPSFVLTTETSEKCVRIPCNIPKHAFAKGSVSIEFALEAFRKQGGDETRKAAEERLKEGKRS